MANDFKRFCTPNISNSSNSTIYAVPAGSGSAALEFVSYALEEPAFDVKECQVRGLTYASPLRVKVRLIIYDKENVNSKNKDVKVKDSAQS